MRMEMVQQATCRNSFSRGGQLLAPETPQHCLLPDRDNIVRRCIKIILSEDARIPKVTVITALGQDRSWFPVPDRSFWFSSLKARSHFCWPADRGAVDREDLLTEAGTTLSQQIFPVNMVPELTKKAHNPLYISQYGSNKKAYNVHFSRITRLN